jgi:hypothetical protein
MYEIIYKENGEKKRIKKGDLFIPISEDNRDYKQYLIDVEDGVEVIDNPPSEEDKKNNIVIEIINIIDNKTGQLISEGFTFDGKKFSMSNNAQINWAVLKMIKDDITYPYPVSTIDDDEYLVQQADFETFLNTAIGFKETLLSAGRELKKQIKSLTLEELNNWEDQR